MKRLLILLFLLALIAIAAGAYKDPGRSALANGTVSDFWRQREPTYAVQIPRGSNGGFAVQARNRFGRFPLLHAFAPDEIRRIDFLIGHQTKHVGPVNGTDFFPFLYIEPFNVRFAVARGRIGG